MSATWSSWFVAAAELRTNFRPFRGESSGAGRDLRSI
jgi:hypothetical protein